MHWYGELVATRARTDELSELLDRIIKALRDVGEDKAQIDVSWLAESPDSAEVLVEVTLPDPDPKDTWSQETTSAIRSAIRQATSEVMPWAVATTRLLSAADDA
jgi:hypothetical protein